MKELDLILEKRLQTTFQKALNLPVETDFKTLEFNKTAEWDSIAHLHLIAALEAEFNIFICGAKHAKQCSACGILEIYAASNQR